LGNCYICGAQIDKLQIDNRDLKTMPCGECLDIVEETLDFWNEDGVYYYLEGDEADIDVETTADQTEGQST
jgi:hypothetical protein